MGRVLVSGLYRIPYAKNKHHFLPPTDGYFNSAMRYNDRSLDLELS